MDPRPLAMRMKPITIEEIIGQEHITHKDSLLSKMVRNECLQSIILYGPPGTGKTSIANVIASTTKADFHKINAVSGKKGDLEKVVEIAQKNLENDLRTILFIDEIHRFNTAQQDYLLPFVENGTIILIGATTENPAFAVNKALVSRSKLFQLEPIEKEDILILLDRALTDERGLKDCGKTVPDEVKNFIADMSSGDVRHALNMLEMAVQISTGDTITLDEIKDLSQQTHLRYDKDGDMHYDTISAFIKSMRGSDPDAVLYYLARMIQAGEDPTFIARRIMIHASEDVGNADPMALVVATSASLAAERIGFPEAQIILSQAALYVAMAPKSNTSCVGIGEAMEYVSQHPTNDIPMHLRDAHYKFAKKLGHGNGYKYPHDYPNHWTYQQYLPDSVVGQRFYHNSHNGYEKTQADLQNWIRTQTNNNGTP